jgi:hypothetical protein
MYDRLKVAFAACEAVRRAQAAWDRRWRATERRFLAAVARPQRLAVAALLQRASASSLGLRSWLCAQSLPPELIRVYLEDTGAAPLDECEACQLALPVRPGAREGNELHGARAYFLTCPLCGGRSSWYAAQASRS